MPKQSLFQSEILGDTVIVVPTRDMGEFEMVDQEVAPYDQLLELVNGHNVVIDLSQTDYIGSSTIGLFTKLVMHVHKLSRKMAFCHLSDHEKEVVEITQIGRFWDIKESRQEAVDFVSSPDAS